MLRYRLGIGWALSAALFAAGICGAVLTYEAWIPCNGDDFILVCLATMDSPGHIASLANLWLLSLALAVAAVFVLRARAARALCISAAGLVLLMNGGTDYMLSLAVAGGHHDVPPGTGYGQAFALVLAGVLVGAGTLVDTRRSRQANVSDDVAAAVPTASASV